MLQVVSFNNMMKHYTVPRLSVLATAGTHVASYKCLSTNNARLSLLPMNGSSDVDAASPADFAASQVSLSIAERVASGLHFFKNRLCRQSTQSVSVGAQVAETAAQLLLQATASLHVIGS